jgi:DNA-binding beta-propeller fold protein YncE
MRMKRALPLLITGAMVLLMLPQPALAGSQAGVLTHFVTVPVTGLTTEGIANKGNSFYVTTIGFTSTNGSIFVFDKKGTLTQTFNLPGLPVVGQPAVYKGSLFVVACDVTLSSGAVVKIDLKTGLVNTTFSPVSTGCPNGLTMDDNGNIFIANFDGSVDLVTQTGAMSLFASGGLLTPGTINGFTIGPNDIVYNEGQNALYTTNTGTNTVVKIQILHHETPGAVTAYAAVLTPDGLVFDKQGNLYVASPFTNSIFLVSPGGASVSQVVFGGTEKLDTPSAAIIVGNTMYITNSNSALTYPSGYVSEVVLN